MRHVSKSELIEAMRESLRNLENTKLLSPDDLDILKSKHDLEAKISKLERQDSEGKKQPAFWWFSVFFVAASLPISVLRPSSRSFDP